jgi:flavin-dependent dehydrogenase
MTGPGRAHAIVIGGGMAGLFAARVLGAHFARVTMIERDILPTQSEHRPGVPQSHHVHALLLRGLLELERLFPGIERELRDAGAAQLDLGMEVAHCTEWGWAPRAPQVGIAPLTMSRLLVESVVRARVRRELSNLRLLDGARAAGLLVEHHEDRVRVRGVRMQGAELPADLVVDASGRNSKCLEWLQQSAVAAPTQTVVDAFAGYASRFYELAPQPQRWWRGMVIDPKPPAMRRWALLMPVERGAHVLTLGGVNRDYPPGDEQGFTSFLNGLRSRELAHTLHDATALSAIHTHRSLANRARAFHTWQANVAGFVALGDSAVAFNASHGQGTSMAALSANTLHQVLGGPRRDPYLLTRRFHQRQWKALRGAWELATGGDMLWPETSGRRPWGYGWKTALTVAVVRAAHRDPVIKRMIVPIYQLTKSSTSLLYRPDLLARVLLAELRRTRADTLKLPEGTLELDR